MIEHRLEVFVLEARDENTSQFTSVNVSLSLHFSYIATVPENVVEGTALIFEGGMDKVQDLDKVRSSV